MIHFILGKPGGGKTYLAIRRILDELKNGNRAVVTNVDIRPDEIADVLRGEGSDCDVIDRLHYVDGDRAREFFRVRPVRRGSRTDVYRPPVVLADKGEGELDLSPIIERPDEFYAVLYVIDEVHLLYPAREWQKTGKRLLWVGSQHRKLGDEWVCITQSHKNVETQLVRLYQDFTVCVNGSYRHIIRGVRARRDIRVAVYDAPPDRQSSPQRTESFVVDPKREGRCYRTQGGVGIRGLKSPQEERARGLPPWVLLLAPFAFAGAAWLGAKGLSKGFSAIGAAAMPDRPKAVATNTSTNAVPPAAPPGAVPAPAPGSRPGVPGRWGPGPAMVAGRQAWGGPPVPTVRVSGVWAGRGTVTVYLEDGREVVRPGYEAAAWDSRLGLPVEESLLTR